MWWFCSPSEDFFVFGVLQERVHQHRVRRVESTNIYLYCLGLRALVATVGPGERSQLQHVRLSTRQPWLGISFSRLAAWFYE